MNPFEVWKLKIKRADTPFYKFLRDAIRGVMHANLPLPNFILPLFRLLYEFHFFLIVVCRRTIIYFYKEPLFRARCASVGPSFNLYTDMPYVLGHVNITIGANVTFTGPVSIISGRFLDQPVLDIRNNVVIGGNSVISVNQKVVIEDHVMISTHCRIADNDGHPRDAEQRANHGPLRARDIRPVTIRRYAWIGNGSQIMKGVTIGEGAIIGANSVVISDIPDYCIAMGNPAEVFMRNVGRPKTSTNPDVSL